MKTSAATAKRRAAYNTACVAALEYLQEAQIAGHKAAHDVATFLNARGISAPTNDTWTDKAVLRVQKRLKVLGLGDGPLRPEQARSYGLRKIREGKPTSDQRWMENAKARASKEGISLKS